MFADDSIHSVADMARSLEKRSFRPRPLGDAVSRVAARPLRARGLAEARIVADWPLIVGAQLAARTMPERLAHPRGGDGGTLHLRAESGVAIELQHLEPLVIERINGYFGYRAVARLRIVQAPVAAPAPPAPRPGRALTAAERETVAQTAADVADEGLRESLIALGRALAAREPA